MKTSNQILDFYGKTNAAYLHPKGALATKLLIEKIECQKEDKILEIGFGTGATLVHLLSRCREANFYGVEISPLMYRKAQSRMRFCMVKKRADIRLIENAFSLPFDDNFFDKVYLESVLAIQEGQSISSLLAEIRRVLRAKGKLILNEALWVNTIPRGEIAIFNEHCKAAFGIIQANGLYPYPESWRTLLKENHFEVLFLESIDKMKPVNPYLEPLSLSEQLSRLFTLWGKIKATFHPSRRKEYQQYRRAMHNLSTGKPLVEGKIIVCELEEGRG